MPGDVGVAVGYCDYRSKCKAALTEKDSPLKPEDVVPKSSFIRIKPATVPDDFVVKDGNTYYVSTAGKYFARFLGETVEGIEGGCQLYRC